MDGLTFSFADSNIRSFVLESTGMTISKGHNKAMPSAFAATNRHGQKRIGLTQANAFAAIGVRNVSKSIALHFNSGNKGRDRGATD